MTSIQTYKLDAAFSSMQKFDPMAKPDDFMEVSIWRNSEGIDVHLSSHSNQYFALTWPELRALKKLVKELDSND